MRSIYMRQILFIYVLFLGFFVNAQNSSESKSKLKMGFNYGSGKQQSFPFNSDSYMYDVQFYKIQLNYRVIEKRKWEFEINVEPGIYLNQHQLLNDFNTQQKFGDNSLEKNLEFFKKKQLNEYVLNLGFIARYKIINYLSTYGIASIGPMYSNLDTERMSAGFAFSDILGLGMGYKIDDVFLDLRFSVRHVSNAGFRAPNKGYNSANIEMGFSCQL